MLSLAENERCMNNLNTEHWCKDGSSHLQTDFLMGEGWRNKMQKHGSQSDDTLNHLPIILNNSTTTACYPDGPIWVDDFSQCISWLPSLHETLLLSHRNKKP